MPRIPWHKQVQRNAAAMQEASAVIAEVIASFEKRGLDSFAEAVRCIAMERGVQETAVWFRDTVVRPPTQVL